MAEKNISQHKRLAMGDRPDKRYAHGGPIITPPRPRVAPPPPIAAQPATGTRLRVPGQPMNPVTKMKMQNGIPGMKRGGKLTKKGC
jgi:hypothetical protein